MNEEIFRKGVKELLKIIIENQKIEEKLTNEVSKLVENKEDEKRATQIWLEELDKSELDEGYKIIFTILIGSLFSEKKENYIR